MLVTPLSMMQWPWLRQLPVRMWIGRDWAMTPRGPEKLPINVRVPGADVWHSRGEADFVEDTPESLMLDAKRFSRAEEISSDSTFIANNATQILAIPSTLPVGICYAEPNHRNPGGMFMCMQKINGKHTYKTFSVRTTAIKDVGVKQARLQAYRQAVVHRSFVRGVDVEAAPSKQPTVSNLMYDSGIHGVRWDMTKKWWIVDIPLSKQHKGKKRKTFVPSNETHEEIEKCKKMAMEFHNSLKVQSARQSGTSCVNWCGSSRKNRWELKIQSLSDADKKILGTSASTYIRNFIPHDMDEKTIEQFRKNAVNHKMEIFARLGRTTSYNKHQASPPNLCANVFPRISGVRRIVWEPHIRAWKCDVVENCSIHGQTFIADNSDDTKVEIVRLEAITQMWQHERDVVDPQCGAVFV